MQDAKKTDSGGDIALRILGKQIELLYGNQTFAIVITMSIAIASFFYFSTYISWDVLQDSVLLFIVATILRTSLNFLYFSARKKNSINLKRAEILYLAGIISTGIFWCVTTISLFPFLDLKGQVLLLIVIIGFATGAQTTMGYLKLPVVSFMSLLIVPLVFVMYGSDMPGGRDIALAIVLYFLFLLRSSLMFYKNTYNMLHFQEIAIDHAKELLLQKEESNSANLAKTEFLSRMSHELRTPLNAILGFTELQLRDKKFPLSDKQSLRTRKIGDAGKHLLSIVNDVLDFSRIETGSMEINLEVTNLYKAILMSIRLLEDKASQRNVEISVEKSRLDVSVLADINRLKQIIVNLVDNAIKFNKLGGKVLIRIDVGENNRVRLYVIDTGFGLQGGDVEDLFVPFSRLGADELGIDGTGIGLSLCKELIELMGGDIGIDKHSSEGCSFWIELPYVSTNSEMEDNSLSEKSSLSSVSTVNVLLVEDNLVNSEVAAEMLAAIGIQVDVAHHGQQALELFKENQYSLILMDCEMPVMDGFSTTKQLRIIESSLQKENLKKGDVENEAQQMRIPIIALTAHAVSGAREKCIASGMDDFLSKPFSMAALHAILYKWLDVDMSNIQQQKVLADDALESNSIENNNDDS